MKSVDGGGLRQTASATAARGDAAALPPAHSAVIAPALLTDDQAAAFLGVGSRKFREMQDDGLLPAPIVLGPRHRRWSRVDLDAAIAAMPRQSAKAAEPAQLLRTRIERAKRTGDLQ